MMEPLAFDGAHNTKTAICIFCKTSKVDEFNLGKIYELRKVVVHYFCMLFSSNLPQRGKSDRHGILGFLPSDIKKEVRRGAFTWCSFCKKRGATIKCAMKTCNTMFHFPCGIDRKCMHQFFGKFLSYCAEHRVQQLAPSQNCMSECPICLNPVENYVCSNSIYASCCGNSWLHRHCIQKQAYTSGYFFKCPLCNDKEKFVSEMKHIGIYIPEQDAAWELESNAYHDLYVGYSKCDAVDCLCSKGRMYKEITGKWSLYVCYSCGSQGCHLACDKNINPRDKWQCSLCIALLNKRSEKNILESGTTSNSQTGNNYRYTAVCNNSKLTSHFVHAVKSCKRTKKYIRQKYKFKSKTSSKKKMRYNFNEEKIFSSDTQSYCSDLDNSFISCSSESLSSSSSSSSMPVSEDKDDDQLQKNLEISDCSSVGFRNFYHLNCSSKHCQETMSLDAFLTSETNRGIILIDEDSDAESSNIESDKTNQDKFHSKGMNINIKDTAISKSHPSLHLTNPSISNSGKFTDIEIIEISSDDDLSL